ncbi:hypothetical protein nbrc107696_27740 [Gordonia spumicola]|uniref:Uncharacterized protein n=1 Tax=Gordonia spumicola TaxID=589161 RepID=A0A7I9VAC1_9ACTN|nr:hypothetical protein [Gordonia spumicola]GEE02328.1 hypothetical protein nbrc107696_27740 [Gordonia spumicola]
MRTIGVKRLAVVGVGVVALGAGSLVGTGDASAWVTRSGHPASVETSGDHLKVSATNPFEVEMLCAVSAFPRADKDKLDELAGRLRSALVNARARDVDAYNADNQAIGELNAYLGGRVLGTGGLRVPASGSESAELPTLTSPVDKYSVLTICKVDLNGDEDDTPETLDLDAQVFNPSAASSGDTWGSLGDLLPI